MGTPKAGTEALDEEAAFLAIADADRNPTAAERARREIAEAYLGPLVGLLHQQKRLPLPVAEAAASSALFELLDKVAEDPGAVGVRDRGVWRWLVNGAVWRARDELRKWRRWAKDHDAGGLDDPEAATATPRQEAEAADLAAKVLRFILALPQPERGILLYDAIDTISELTGEDVDLHDQELIDCSQAHGVWTRDSLRSYRTRARAKLKAFLARVTA